MTLQADFHYAAETGDEATVQQMLHHPDVDPLFNGSDALRTAAFHGHTNVVELLLPVSQPRDNESVALILAAKHGHEACVRLLIPVSDVHAQASAALMGAANGGHFSTANLLVLPGGNLNALLETLRLATRHEGDKDIDDPVGSSRSERSRRFSSRGGARTHFPLPGQ